MIKYYSTCIIPENSNKLLFSVRCEDSLYHCWKNEQKDSFVLIKESNDLTKVLPNQILNFSEKSLKRYLFVATKQLKEIDDLLFFNDVLWRKYID